MILVLEVYPNPGKIYNFFFNFESKKKKFMFQIKITSGASAGLLKYIFTVLMINLEVDITTNASEYTITAASNAENKN